MAGRRRLGGCASMSSRCARLRGRGRARFVLRPGKNRSRSQNQNHYRPAQQPFSLHIHCKTPDLRNGVLPNFPIGGTLPATKPDDFMVFSFWGSRRRSRASPLHSCGGKARVLAEKRYQNFARSAMFLCENWDLQRITFATQSLHHRCWERDLGPRPSSCTPHKSAAAIL
jgi:hypothetical protein